MKEKKQKCPDCKGTGKYVGLGFSPTEDCKKCQGCGKTGGSPRPNQFEIDFEFEYNNSVQG